MYGFHQESSCFSNAVEKTRVNGCFSLSGGRPRRLSETGSRSQLSYFTVYFLFTLRGATNKHVLQQEKKREIIPMCRVPPSLASLLGFGRRNNFMCARFILLPGAGEWGLLRKSSLFNTTLTSFSSRWSACRAQRPRVCDHAQW